MALGPRLEVRQSLSQKMTPQLQQAIQLLQFNSVQIAEFVKAEVEKNPLLEMAAPEPEVYSSLPSSSATTEHDAGPFQNIASQVSLTEFLRAQLREMRLPGEDLELALIVADEIDPDGYLRESVSDVAGRYHIRSKDIVQGLKLVQRCEPAGVGARNLRECLALQLQDRDRFDPAMRTLVENVELAINGDSAELARLCRVSQDDIEDMLLEIRALNPKPGARFGEEPVLTTAPDIFVSINDAGHVKVEINTLNLPKVLVNNIYATEISGQSDEARAYISECRTRANWLVRSLEQRARTILKVSTEIASFQRDFFRHGVSGLKPLTRKTIAERIKMHESTVGRIANGKYLSCAHGNFELRYFFSSSIGSINGGQGFSATLVQNRMLSMIKSECSTDVLSDDKIVTMLRDEGIDIARRTVAKYREQMGVPSSSVRRRQKAGTGKV